MHLDRQILAAQGYSELGMTEEALAELDSLGAPLQNHPEVVNARLYTFMRARRWEDALAAARRLAELVPERTSGYIHAAYCLHEMGRTEEAKSTLLAGPPALRDEATYHYNLGCYEAVLGNHEEARFHLLRSFQLDDKLRAVAQRDPDLVPLRDLLP